MKNLPSKLRVTARHKDEFWLASLRSDHFLKFLCWQEIHLSDFIFNNQVAFRALGSFNSGLRLLHSEAMTGEVKSNGIICQSLRQIIQSGLHFLVLNQFPSAL